MSSDGGTKKKEQRKKRVNEDEEDEVEKLLRATEDDIMLKLSVDSHISRGSSSQIIHPDLDRRFQALRSSSKPPVATAAATKTRLDVKPNQSSVSVDVNDDDLFARFVALKSSLPSHADKRIEKVAKNDDDDYDEVDEIIRWAIDAAALDPSRSDDEDDVHDSSEEESDDDDDDDDDDDGDSTEEKDKKKKKKSTSNITKMK